MRHSIRLRNHVPPLKLLEVRAGTRVERCGMHLVCIELLDVRAGLPELLRLLQHLRGKTPAVHDDSRTVTRIARCLRI